MILVPADVWPTHFCLETVLEIAIAAETVITSSCAKPSVIIILPAHILYFRESRLINVKIERHTQMKKALLNFIINCTV